MIVIEGLQISSLDPLGAEVGQVGSIAIKHVGEIHCCVGYKRVGQQIQQPTSWIYDHTSIHFENQDAPITRPDIDEILKCYGHTIDSLLSIYCRLLTV